MVCFQSHNAVKVTLALPEKPLHTNGEWDSGKLVWEGKLEQERDPAVSTPVLYYAAWVTPNEGSQRRYFGETVLSGEVLMEFCLAHAGLTKVERGELAAALEKLPPPEEWKPRFETLREELEAEFVKNGSPIPKGEFSARAWGLVAPRLPGLPEVAE